MEKSKAAILLAALLMFMLISGVYAQELELGKNKDANGGQRVGIMGLSDPPPAGYSVRYMFTGLVNDANAREATAVHCTNFGDDAVDIRVEAWSLNPITTYSATLTLDPGQTRTFATQIVVGFPHDVILSPAPSNIFQGSGRVLTKQHSDVICTVHALDPTNDPPVFVVKLDLYDGNGNSIGEVRKVYLPVILK